MCIRDRCGEGLQRKMRQAAAFFFGQHELVVVATPPFGLHTKFLAVAVHTGDDPVQRCSPR
eukprot:7197072-Prymnesium_polylepis.1